MAARRTGDISLNTLIVLCLGLLLWVVYGLLKPDGSWSWQTRSVWRLWGGAGLQNSRSPSGRGCRMTLKSTGRSGPVSAAVSGRRHPPVDRHETGNPDLVCGAGEAFLDAAADRFPGGVDDSLHPDGRQPLAAVGQGAAIARAPHRHRMVLSAACAQRRLVASVLWLARYPTGARDHRCVAHRHRNDDSLKLARGPTLGVAAGAVSRSGSAMRLRSTPGWWP